MAGWICVQSADGRSYYGSYCPHCRGKALCQQDDYGDYYVTKESKFCPHCGAKLTGEKITMTQKEFNDDTVLSKKRSIKLLQDVGILDENGKITPVFKDIIVERT